METLEMLGTALGLGALAGINLYLTVFVTGLAIQQGWIALAPQYGHLGVLANPAIVFIAGVLYFLEFFADKVPWVDSLWDSIHTVIRPIGAAFIGIKVLGDANPVFDVVIALLAGGVGLSTHGLKAGTRLIANGSPEPFSNIALSITEDVTVLFGLALVHTHPVLSLLVVIVLVAAIIYLGPKIARAVRAKAWLAWRKLNSRGSGYPVGVEALPREIPADVDVLLHTVEAAGRGVEWAVPCFTSGSKRIGANASGYLVALQGEVDRLHFVSNGWFCKAAETLELAGYKTQVESKFLSENLVLYAVDRRPKRVFMFERSKSPVVLTLADSLRQRLAQTA